MPYVNIFFLNLFQRKSRDGHPGGRGGNRQNAPKMDDEHDFPSLG